MARRFNVSLFGRILKDHAAHCVAHAIKSGNAKDQTEKFSELVELFARYGK